MAKKISGTEGSGMISDSFGGTQGYIAPEILMKLPYSAQSADLFSFAVVLFILVTGIKPFR